MAGKLRTGDVWIFAIFVKYNETDDADGADAGCLCQCRNVGESGTGKLT